MTFFPNEVKFYAKIKYEYVKKLLGKKIFNKYKIKKDFEWKFINLELFKKNHITLK